jgi:hypothetical protein
MSGSILSSSSCGKIKLRTKEYTESCALLLLLNEPLASERCLRDLLDAVK